MRIGKVRSRVNVPVEGSYELPKRLFNVALRYLQAVQDPAVRQRLQSRRPCHASSSN